MLRTLFAKWFARKNARRSGSCSAAGARRPPLRVERLEDRTLFATGLGTASFYNELIFGSKTAGTGQVAGRLVVGGNATFPVSYGVGNTLPSDPTRDDLIVGGNLVNQASWQVNANAVYGGTITGGNTLFHANGTTRQQAPFFSAPPPATPLRPADSPSTSSSKSWSISPPPGAASRTRAS
jgi:choice-of-anchor A domain-containing protein